MMPIAIRMIPTIPAGFITSSEPVYTLRPEIKLMIRTTTAMTSRRWIKPPIV
jgi:hypothetical protein